MNFPELTLCGKVPLTPRKVPPDAVKMLDSGWLLTFSLPEGGSEVKILVEAAYFKTWLPERWGGGWVRKWDTEENGAQMLPGCYCGQLQAHRKTCSPVIPLHSVGSQLLVSVSHRLVAASGECEFLYLTWEVQENRKPGNGGQQLEVCEEAVMCTEAQKGQKLLLQTGIQLRGVLYLH